MTVRRIPVMTVADPEHGTMVLEGDSYEVLPPDRVYVNPQRGIIKDGRSGDRLLDLSGNEIEIPRTTWY
jgi:hypothetical protein